MDMWFIHLTSRGGGSLNGNSDGDFMDMTVMTEKEDLSAVMDFVKTKDYVDQDHLFLLGQSLGRTCKCSDCCRQKR